MHITKTDNVPYSILNFERALKMDPKDEDAQFNLKIASLKVIDKIDPVPQIFYKRWLDSVTRLFTPDSWSKILIICCLVQSVVISNISFWCIRELEENWIYSFSILADSIFRFICSCGQKSFRHLF